MTMSKKFRRVTLSARWCRRLDCGVRIGVLLALFTLFASVPARAVDGRDFAGVYQYARTGDAGSMQQVSLSLRLFNYSGADVTNATVALEGYTPLAETYGSIAGVSISADAAVPVSASFAIPAAEYESWQEGGVPHLSIEFTDAAGHQVRRMIELVPGQAGEQP